MTAQPERRPMLLGDLVAADVTLPDGAGAIDIKGITADSRAVAPRLPVRGTAGIDDRRRALRRATRSARGAVAVLAGADASVDAPAGVAVLRAGDPRRALALDRGALLSASAGAAGRRHRHQRQDLGRRLRPPDLRRCRPRGGEHRHASASSAAAGATYGSLTTPDPVALHATLDRLAARGRHPRRARGVEPRPRPAPARRHPHRGGGLHQSRPRPHGLPPDRRTTISPPSSGCSRVILPKDGTAVVDMDGARAEDVVAAARERGQRLIRVGAARARDPHRRTSTPTGFAQRLTIEAFGKRREVLLPLAGAFQASNALVAAGLAIAAGVDAGCRLRGARRARGRAGPARTGRPQGERRDGLRRLRPQARGAGERAAGAPSDDARAARRRLRRGRRPRPRQAAADGQGRGRERRRRHRHRRQSADARSRRRSARAILAGAPGAIEIGDRARGDRRAIAMLGPGDVLCIAGKGHETGQIVGGSDLPFSDHQAAHAALAAEEAA